MKYNGPKEKLEAAKSPETSPEDLMDLAASEYDFVKAAVAANPHTRCETLEQLLPSDLAGKEDYEVVLGLLKNQNLSAGMFVKIAHLIESIANTISPRDYYEIEVVKELASSPLAPIEAILPLANPLIIPKHLRSRIANSRTRIELLQTLINDPSATISRMATKAVNEVGV